MEVYHSRDEEMADSTRLWKVSSTQYNKEKGGGRGLYNFTSPQGIRERGTPPTWHFCLLLKCKHICSILPPPPPTPVQQLEESLIHTNIIATCPVLLVERVTNIKMSPLQRGPLDL